MKIHRLISIVMLLLKHNIMTASELAKIFNVSTRTIYRDVESLANAGIPIISHSGVNGGIGIIEQYKVGKDLFTVSDITAIIVALSGSPPALNSNSTAAILTKMKNMVPTEKILDIEFQSNNIIIDFNSLMNDSCTSEAFSSIRYAMDNRYVISFQYSESNNTESLVRIEPYRLIYKKSEWHLFGYFPPKKSFLCFRLSCISNIKLINSTFALRKFDSSLVQ